MGFREPIDMGDFVRTSEHLAEVFGVPVDMIIPPPRARTRRQQELPSLGLDDDLYPEPRGIGDYELMFRSTGMELVSWPSVVWDVNGYYHALGVGFRATRKQLLRAYHVKNGQNDEYLTYVFSQLLNAKVRQQYDSCPLGGLFIDRYVISELRKKAVQRAAQMRREGLETTAEDVLDEWGFEPDEQTYIEPDDQEEVDDHPADDQVDTPQKKGEDKTVPSTGSTESWPYTYFLWRVKRRDFHFGNSQSMHRWQEAIASECQARKASLSFGVGLMGEGQGSRIAKMSVGGVNVVFISTGSLDDMEELARYAVQLLITR